MKLRICVQARNGKRLMHNICAGVPKAISTASVRKIEKTYAKILAEKRRDFIERGAPSFAEGRL
jgi:hypothetical protein